MVPPHGFNHGPIDYKSIALPTELQGHRRLSNVNIKNSLIFFLIFINLLIILE